VTTTYFHNKKLHSDVFNLLIMLLFVTHQRLLILWLHGYEDVTFSSKWERCLLFWVMED
jgi:hypothetical protein